MVSKAKKWLIASALVCATLSVALCSTVTLIACASENDAKLCDNRVTISTETAQYVLEDLESTINGVKRAFNCDWKASYIEYMCDVRILTYNGGDRLLRKDGVYVDLDGDNGYYVITPSGDTTADGKTMYRIFDLHTRGDLKCLRGASKLRFSESLRNSGGGLFEYAGSSGIYKKLQTYRQEDLV